MNSYIFTGESLTVYIEGEDFNIHKSHINFDAIVEAIGDSDWESVKELIDVSSTLNSYGKGVVRVVEGVVMYNDTPLHNAATDRVLDMLELGLPIDPMLRFIDRTMDNPSYRVVEELYSFLEYGKLPITEDGCFIAWKVVTDDLKDIHTNTYDNSPGQVVSMPRNQVNEDPDQTCSYGLHVCSKEYIPHFGGDSDSRVVIQVKIDPKDVVAIPRDYDNTKMRVCEYEVIKVHDKSLGYDYNSPVYDPNDWYDYTAVRTSDRKDPLF